MSDPSVRYRLSSTINTPGDFAWALDGPQPNDDYDFSDGPHDEISASVEEMATCRSRSHAGPVVAAMIESGVSRAWVLPDVDPGGTWLRVDTATIDATRMLQAIDLAYEYLPG